MVATRVVDSLSDIPGRYLGAVSCRFMVPDTLNAGVLSQMIRRADFVRDDVVGGYLVFPNFYVTSSGVDTAPGAERTITASIEYPAGTMNQVLFNGSATGTAADGQARLVSDYIELAIPRGSQIWFNTRQASSAGIIIAGTTGAFAAFGDQQTIGSNVTDNTMVPGWSGTAGGNPYGPVFVALTRRATVAIIGDSRAQGFGNTSNSVPYPGEIAPSVAPFMGTINLARGSVTAQQTANTSNSAKRAEYLAYVSHGILQVGTNDIVGGRTAAEVIADRTTIKGIASDLIWFDTTVGPKTTSTDSFATLTNQTADATNSVRTAFNDLVRGGTPGFKGFFDVADTVESARNSGIYKAPPLTAAAITADGNHQNNAGYALARTAINPAMLTL